MCHECVCIYMYMCVYQYVCVSLCVYVYVCLYVYADFLSVQALIICHVY